MAIVDSVVCVLQSEDKVCCYSPCSSQSQDNTLMLNTIVLKNCAVSSLRMLVSEEIHADAKIISLVGFLAGKETVTHSGRTCVYAIIAIPKANEGIRRTLKSPVLWYSKSNAELSFKSDRFYPDDAIIVEKIIKGQYAPLSLLSSATVDDYKPTFNLPPLSTDDRVVLNMAGYHRRELEALFLIFSHYSWPFTYLSLPQFEELMQAAGWKDSYYLGCLFRAFNDSGNERLSFWEFVLGCALMESKVTHGGFTGLSRSKRIFHFYAADTNHMQLHELRELVSEIVRLRWKKGEAVTVETDSKDTCFHDDLQSEVEKCAKIFVDYNCISIQDFVSAIGELKLRGTSSLFRIPNDKSFLTLFGELLASLSRSSSQQVDKPKITVLDGATQTQSEEPAYEVSSVHAKMGSVIEGGAISKLEWVTTNHANEVAKVLVCSDIHNVSEKSSECATFASSEVSFCAKSMMRAINFFINSYVWKKRTKAPFCWGLTSLHRMKNCLLELCGWLEANLKSEPKLVDINGPVYVFGSLDGNLRRLAGTVGRIWPLGFELSCCRALFLGDFIGDCEHNVEVLCYLFALKCLFFEDVFLVRGQSEVSTLTVQNSSFSKQCLFLFGEGAREVIDAIRRCFNAMPVAAIVDSKCFCVRGGIPQPLRNGDFSVKSIFKETASTTGRGLLQLLFGYPLLSGQSNMPQFNNDGFLPVDDSSSSLMESDGTNEVYAFSTTALNRFLDHNGLLVVIRVAPKAGNEVGVDTASRRIVSVANSDESSNMSSCLFVARNKIKKLVIDLS